MATKRRPVMYFHNEECCEQVLISKKNLKKSKDKDPIKAISPELFKMLNTLVEKYSTKIQWRNYSYIDDMKQEAMIALLRGALKFNPNAETRSGKPNPLGYYTQIVTHAFINVLNREKKHRDIKDDMMENAGMLPSFSRQMQNDPSLKDAHRWDRPEDEDLIK